MLRNSVEWYLGDGGIPGYIMVSLVPNEYTISRIQGVTSIACMKNVKTSMPWESYLEKLIN